MCTWCVHVCMACVCVCSDACAYGNACVYDTCMCVEWCMYVWCMQVCVEHTCMWQCMSCVDARVCTCTHLLNRLISDILYGPLPLRSLTELNTGSESKWESSCVLLPSARVTHQHHPGIASHFYLSPKDLKYSPLHSKVLSHLSSSRISCCFYRSHEGRCSALPPGMKVWAFDVAVVSPGLYHHTRVSLKTALSLHGCRHSHSPQCPTHQFPESLLVLSGLFANSELIWTIAQSWVWFLWCT